MILHIGNGKTVRGEEIIGIFDLDNATLSKDSRTYLSAATRAGEVSYADSDIPRAFLVTGKRRKKITQREFTSQREDTNEKSPPCVKGGGRSEESDEGIVTFKRPRHPARAKKAKKTPPAQGVLLSHISSAALHARCERPFEEE